MKSGVLADHQIRAMIAEGGIAASSPILNDQVQPASLDLRLGDTAYRVRASFLAGKDRTVTDRLDELTPHLDRRIDIMLERGAVEEARAAWKKCPDPDAPGWSGIGCAELLQHVRGIMSLDEARHKWLHNTRQYAKRQLTWFNRERDIEWFDPGEAEAVAGRVSDWLSGSY